MPSTPFLAGSLLLLLGLSGGAFADSAVEERRLENGLRVMLRPLPGATDVALIVLYSMGGFHDPEGQSGLGHLVEHVYVTAAAGEAPARTVVEYAARYPAGWNAQTGEDYTVFATVFPGERMGEEIADAAARMGDLRVEASDLEREVPRLVAEVGNMFGGIPPLAAINHARERLRPTPAGGRRGGIPDQVAALGVEDIADRWRRFYKPANALVVVAGGFEPGTVAAEIERRFGAIPAGEPAPVLVAPGPPAIGADPLRVAALQAGAPAEVSVSVAPPAPADPLYAPFLVLVARLWKRAPGLLSASARFPVTYAPLDDPTVFSIGLSVDPGETAEQALDKIDHFLGDATGQPFDATELAPAREAFGFLLGTIDLPESVLAKNPYSVAFGIGRRAQLGIDPARLGAAMHAVDADGVARAAALFAREKRAVAIVTAGD